MLGLSVDDAGAGVEPILAAEHQAWSRLLAEGTQPWYGWGGGGSGLLGDARLPVPGRRVLALEPQPVQWLNVFGPRYVERLGAARLLALPAWRVEFLTNGSVCVTLGSHPDQVDRASARASARALGAPAPPDED